MKTDPPFRPHEIAVLISGASLGGGEKFALDLARDLHRRENFQVALFCPGGGEVAHRAAEFLPPGRRKHFSFHDLPDPLETLRFLYTLRKLHPALLHCHLNRASLYGGLAGRLLGIPCIATVHGLNRRIYYRFAHRVVAVSERGAAHLLEQGIPTTRLSTIRNGVDTEYWRPVPPVDSASRKNQICCSGRLHPAKGQARLLRALALLAKKGSYHLHLLGDGPEETALRALARDLTLTDQVTFHGFQRDPRPVLNSCEILTLPSESESLPLAVLEGMSLGLKIVASGVGDLPHLLARRGCFQIPNLSPETIADTIITAGADSHPLPYPGLREFIEDEHSWARTFSRHLDLIKTILPPGHREKKIDMAGGEASV